MCMHEFVPVALSISPGDPPVPGVVTLICRHCYGWKWGYSQPLVASSVKAPITTGREDR